MGSGKGSVARPVGVSWKAGSTQAVNQTGGCFHSVCVCLCVPFAPHINTHQQQCMNEVVDSTGEHQGSIRTSRTIFKGPMTNIKDQYRGAELFDWWDIVGSTVVGRGGGGCWGHGHCRLGHCRPILTFIEKYLPSDGTVNLFIWCQTT